MTGTNLRLRRNRRGVMLLIVTLVLTSLTLAGAALLTLMKTENAATSTRGREALVRGVDRSAVVFLIGALELTPEEREQKGGFYNNPDYFCAVPLLTTEEGGADTSRFTVLSPKLDDSRIEGIRYGLVDESTRLNLEAVLEWDRETPGAGREALMKLPGMTAIAADSILDWIDPDETPRQNGAEAGYYADKKLPYSPRNATPVFLEELLLARGVTRSQLYGTDESFTYGIESAPSSEEETGLGGSLTALPSLAGNSGRNSSVVPWKELVTVFSAEKDADPTGEARVDLNGTNLEFLYSELSSRVGNDLAKFVVLLRQYGPVAAEEPAQTGPGARGGNRQRRQSGYFSGNANSGATSAQNEALASATPGTLSSATLDYSVPASYALTSPLDVVGATVLAGNVSYASPIKDDRAKASTDLLFTLLDYASTSQSTTIVGRLNVNAAPRAPLSALPGIAAADVERIMSQRPDPAKPLAQDYRHASWLYTKGVLSLEQMKKLYNKTTARGDVYRGQIIGFLESSDETSRAEVVVDGTTVPPRQVFYKDLTTLGKGFADAELLGGLTTSSNSGADGTSLAGEASFEILDIQRQGSGYAPGAGNANPSADPFAALDFATGTNPETQTDPTTGGALGTLPDATATQTPGLTDPLADPATATASEADQTEAAPPTQQSRRERTLELLQNARQSRRERNQGSTNAAAQNAETPESSAAEAGEGVGAGAAPAGTSARTSSGRTTSDRSSFGTSTISAATSDVSTTESAAASSANQDSDSSDRRSRMLDALRSTRNSGRNRSE